MPNSANNYISNDGSPANGLNINLAIAGGAVYIAANDLAAGRGAAGANNSAGALGGGTLGIQIGISSSTNPLGYTATSTPPLVSSNSGANLALMSYGPGAGVGVLPTLTEGRNIVVGGPGVDYNSVTLGGFTNDYSAYTGNITLNQDATTPTTFTAANGGRVDFTGAISGNGSVLVGNSTVEGDAVSPGIALTGNGIIAFNGSNTYTGSTTVNAGSLYVNGSLSPSSTVTINSGGILRYGHSKRARRHWHGWTAARDNNPEWRPFPSHQAGFWAAPVMRQWHSLGC